MIAENLQKIKENIASVCKKSNRNSDEIVLVAVTKIFPPEVIQEAARAGIYDFGENFVQEIRDKKEKILNSDIRWHFIGHLQTNKVKYIAPWIFLIHSVDSLSLASELDKRAEQANRKINFLLEIHTTNEATKYGIIADITLHFAQELQKFKNIQLQGLMTMGPLSEKPEDARTSFRCLRELREDLFNNGINAPHLSMGMSGDYEVAIEEGATIIRLGTALFGKRIYTT